MILVAIQGGGRSQGGEEGEGRERGGGGGNGRSSDIYVLCHGRGGEGGGGCS